MNWQPRAEISTLKKRAQILASIRSFFAAKNVMEVDTPAMSQAAVTDHQLHTFHTQFQHPSATHQQTLFLQTSPEYAMKRLLAAGSGDIYQICKSFRNEEAGRYHNPEFTMLEWYRVGFNHHDLMDEMDGFLATILGSQKGSRLTYQQVFVDFLSVDPLVANIEAIRQLCCKYDFGDFVAEETDKDILLQLLFCHVIEPEIGKNAPCFIYDFPASQAALAKLDPEDERVAHRFEVYFKGMELANGFYELTDAKEQSKRFTQDNIKREALGLPHIKVDELFLNALGHGLPECAGVALGIDRLIMLASTQSHIQNVIAFPVERA